MRTPSRRSMLASLGTAIVGLAGCSSTDSASPTGTETSTSTQTVTPTLTATGTLTDTDTPTDTQTPTDSASDVPTTGQPGGVEAFDDALVPLLDQWEIPGATVAVMDGERLVFTRGYGTVGPDSDDPVHPDAFFRIGSLSKPITAVAILDLVEETELSLDDLLVDVLAELVPDSGPADPRVEEITIRQLLTHTAGWSTGTVGFDPVFAPTRVAESMDTAPPASAETTVRFMFEQELATQPGRGFQYSNVGYCMLGRIIESVTGRDYETYVRDSVLSPLDAGEMAIGATREANRRDGEVRYLSRATVESPFPGEGEVPRPYGSGVLAEAIDADGGWVGRASDLLRFVRGIDGRAGVADVLGAETRETMLTRPDVSRWEGTDQYYGMGWFVTEQPDGPLLWHNGSLPGSYTFLAHDQDTTLVALFNGRSPDQLFGQFNASVQRTVLEASADVASWPDRDLFADM